MSPRLIVSDSSDGPGIPLLLEGGAIAPDSNQQAIGKLLVDQVWAEGSDPAGRCSAASATPTPQWRLQQLGGKQRRLKDQRLRDACL